MHYFKKYFVWFLFLWCLAFNVDADTMENIFYILRSDNHESDSQQALNSFKQHYKTINILISQAYQVDANGNLLGHPNPEAVMFAKTHGIKVMPLVTNKNYDPQKTHKFLHNPFAMNRAIHEMVATCQQYHYYGLQIDFESASLKDYGILNRFYQRVSKSLHQAGFKVSFALAPLTSDKSRFLKRIYEAFKSAYQFKAINNAADFVSIMAYDQHCGGTNPGPNASIGWDEKAIEYALKYFPRKKISLGVPDYSYYWYTREENTWMGERIKHAIEDLSFKGVDFLMNTQHVHLKWDRNQKVDYAIFGHYYSQQYLFVEDKRSFEAKLDLVKKYHLRGISVFRLGLEDPKIWNVLALNR